MINLYCRPEEIESIPDIGLGACVAASEYIDRICGWPSLLRSGHSLVFHGNRLQSRLPLISATTVEDGYLSEQGYVWDTANMEDYHVDAVSRKYWGHQPFVRITGEWGWGLKMAHDHVHGTDTPVAGLNFLYDGDRYYSDEDGNFLPAVAGVSGATFVDGTTYRGHLLEPEYTVNLLAMELAMIFHWKSTTASKRHGREADRWASKTAEGFSVYLRKYRKDMY